jgi:hypothetical protein
MSAIAIALTVAAVRPATGRWAAVAIGVVVLLDPTFSTAIQRIPGAEDDALHGGIVTNYTAVTPISAFLSERADDEPTFRFFGYDPGLMLSPDLDLRSYLVSGVSEREPPALLVNNRSILLGLEDIQGYSPVQSEQYVAFIEFANRRQQSYHFANILPWGWSSPLIDLLNVRYIVVPRAVPPGRPDLLHLSQTMPTVFQHGDQRVVVNENALPRSWIVHDVRLVERSRILHLLRSAREDPRTVAYVADGAALPALEPGADAAGESVRVVAREPDRITLEVTSDGDGLVVLSKGRRRPSVRPRGQRCPSWRRGAGRQPRHRDDLRSATRAHGNGHLGANSRVGPRCMRRAGVERARPSSSGTAGRRGIIRLTCTLPLEHRSARTVAVTTGAPT